MSQHILLLINKKTEDKMLNIEIFTEIYNNKQLYRDILAFGILMIRMLNSNIKNKKHTKTKIYEH